MDPREPLLIREWRRLRGRPADGPGRYLSAGELSQAAADLLGLQRGLTGDRRLVGSRYMDEASRLGAYLLFYWPVSAAQTRGLLKLAFPAGSAGVFPARPLRVLDLGSGPAPGGLAAAGWLQADQPRTLTACDRSGLALESAARLAAAAGIPFTGVPGWTAGSSPLPAGSFDVIILGHLLNELWQRDDDRLERRFAFIQEVGRRLAPEGILLLMEPALSATGRELLALRDALVAAPGADGATWSVAAPCFRDGPCPVLAEAGRTCHSDFSWPMPPLVRELAARTGLDKDLVKTTGFVLRRRSAGSAGAGSQPSAEHRYRVISEPMLNKAGRTRLLLCGAGGLVTLSAKKGQGYPAEADFLSLKRSDAVTLAGAEVRENGLGLGPETILHVLSRR